MLAVVTRCSRRAATERSSVSLAVKRRLFWRPPFRRPSVMLWDNTVQPHPVTEVTVAAKIRGPVSTFRWSNQMRTNILPVGPAARPVSVYPCGTPISVRQRCLPGRSYTISRSPGRELSLASSMTDCVSVAGELRNLTSDAFYLGEGTRACSRRSYAGPFTSRYTFLVLPRTVLCVSLGASTGGHRAAGVPLAGELLHRKRMARVRGS